jgi:hypothetical protein
VYQHTGTGDRGQLDNKKATSEYKVRTAGRAGESGWIGNSVLLVSSPPDRDTTVSEGLGCVFHRGGSSRK